MSRGWPTSVDRAQREVLPLNLALYHAAREYPGGVKAIAAVFGLNPTTLQHKLSPTHHPHRANIDDLEAVLTTTQDDRILDAVGEMAGGALWVRPDACDARDDASLILMIARLQKELAEMLDSVAESTADGIVDAHERAELRKRARHLMQAVLALELAAGEMGEARHG